LTTAFGSQYTAPLFVMNLDNSMSLLGRMIRAVLWGVVTGGLLSIVRQASDRQMDGAPPRKSPATNRLHRDPVCGTYVSGEISVKLEQAGHIAHFCSTECRERYAQPAARAAGA